LLDWDVIVSGISAIVHKPCTDASRDSLNQFPLSWSASTVNCEDILLLSE
jgi:hypothetical protein